MESVSMERHFSGGKSGLINLGNTCYMNSALQPLTHTTPLRKYLLSSAYTADLNKKKPEWSVTWELVRLFNAMWESNCIIKPHSFKETLSKNQHLFVGFRQHDTHEVLIFILDLIHKGICYRPVINIKGEPVTDKDKMAVKACEMWKLSHAKEYSFIVELFYGQYHAQATCGECGTISDSFDPFCYLSLPITPRTGNIIHCLNEFTHPETLSDDNKYDCEKCEKKTDAKRQLIFWKTPDVLIMTLKRFNLMHKVTKKIDFPLEGLNLGDYVNGYDKHRSVYDLYAVGNHIGGTAGGHYYAYCLLEDGWHEFNDSSVTPMRADKVVTSAAYVLYYRKRGAWEKYDDRFEST